MSEFSLFTERFVGRYLKLIGIKSFKLPHSPISVSGILAITVISVMITGIAGSSDFEKSRLKLGYSPTLANNFFMASKSAAEEHDYALAKQLYEMGLSEANGNLSVLGVESEIQETVFPEVALEKELMEIEEILTKQPTYRDLLIRKALILYQLKLDNEALETLEQVILLDPNNEDVKKLSELLGREE